MAPPIPRFARNLLRPLVYRLRRAARTLGATVRPMRPWDGQHHPALQRFTPWVGQSDGRYMLDFLGIKTDPKFRPYFQAAPQGQVETKLPSPHAAYFELAFVLDVVQKATAARPFTMIELGASFGPWIVTTTKARELTSGGETRLVGVEMNPSLFGFMREHLANNGINPDDHRLIQAAVSDVDGSGAFQIETDKRLEYGQSLVDRGADEMPSDSKPGRQSVRTVSLPTLIHDIDRVDLIHVDIQGEEHRVIPHARGLLKRKVAHLLVATHSKRIHRDVLRVLTDDGWSVRYNFGCRARERTPYGDIHFLDGLLAAANPTLISVGENP